MIDLLLASKALALWHISFNAQTTVYGTIVVQARSDGCHPERETTFPNHQTPQLPMGHTYPFLALHRQHHVWCALFVLSQLSSIT